MNEYTLLKFINLTIRGVARNLSLGGEHNYRESRTIPAVKIKI